MAITLRKMTMLSRFDGGKYSGQKVETIVKLDSQYIRYEYFCMSKLSFTDDVLLSVGVTEEYRIGKPGKDRVMLHKFNLDAINKLSAIDKIKHFNAKRKDRKVKAELLHARHVNDNKKILSKASLQSMNTGNTKLQLDYRRLGKSGSLNP